MEGIRYNPFMQLQSLHCILELGLRKVIDRPLDRGDEMGKLTAREAGECLEKMAHPKTMEGLLAAVMDTVHFLERASDDFLLADIAWEIVQKKELEEEEEVLTPLKLEESCGHLGCLNHVSHPCEKCGRIAGRSKPGWGPPPVQGFVDFAKAERRVVAEYLKRDLDAINLEEEVAQVTRDAAEKRVDASALNPEVPLCECGGTLEPLEPIPMTVSNHRKYKCRKCLREYE